MDQILADLRGVVSDTGAWLMTVWDAMARAAALLPDWLLATILAGVLGVVILIAGMARPRGGLNDREDFVFGERRGETPGGPPFDQEDRRPAPGVMDIIAGESGTRELPMRSESTAPPQPDREAFERPVLAGLAESLEARGVTGADLDGRIRRFAADLPELEARLAGLKPERSDLEPLLQQARSALASGDLDHGVSLLVEAGEAESESFSGVRRKLDNHARAAAESRLLAGDFLLAQDAAGDAITLYKRALAEAPADETELRVECLNKLGAAQYAAQAYEAAAKTFEEALIIMEDALGETHPELTPVVNNLALAKDGAGDRQEAERLHRRALRSDERAKGPDHPDVAADLNNLALLYKRWGRLGAAESLLRRALSIKRGRFSQGDPALALGLRNLAAVLRERNKPEEAEELEREANLLTPSTHKNKSETAASETV